MLVPGDSVLALRSDAVQMPTKEDAMRCGFRFKDGGTCGLDKGHHDHVDAYVAPSPQPCGYQFYGGHVCGQPKDSIVHCDAPAVNGHRWQPQPSPQPHPREKCGACNEAIPPPATPDAPVVSEMEIPAMDRALAERLFHEGKELGREMAERMIPMQQPAAPVCEPSKDPLDHPCATCGHRAGLHSSSACHHDSAPGLQEMRRACRCRKYRPAPKLGAGDAEPPACTCNEQDGEPCPRAEYFKAKQLRASNAALTTEVAGLRELVAALTTSFDAANAALGEERREVAGLRAERVSLEEALETMHRGGEGLRADIAGLRERLALVESLARRVMWNESHRDVVECTDCGHAPADPDPLSWPHEHAVTTDEHFDDCGYLRAFLAAGAK